jgi:L-alanine-DL-glutamate epimerase-like enolase superfamily enzyme
MRIVRIEVDRLSLPLDPPFHASWDPTPRRSAPATVVRVHTDEGVVGVGGGDTLHGVEPHLPLLLRTDPLRIEEQVRRLETIDFHAGRPWPLEVALWDLFGKVCGQPVWRLMGGACDRVAAYASLGARRDAAAVAAVVGRLRAEGFGACKLRIDPHAPDEAVAAVTAARGAGGPDLVLMVDCNQAWRMAGDTARPADLAALCRLVDALDELDVAWVEEPLLAADHAGLAALRARTRLRIAGGELTRTTDELLSDVADDRYDVHQPDVTLSGMWRGRTVAELALRRGRWYTPHTWTDGIGLLANLHVCAGVGGGPWLEYPYDPDGWTPDRRDFMLVEPVGIHDGAVVAPDRPGLGVELDDEVIAATRVDRLEVTIDDTGTVGRPVNGGRRP